MQKRKFDELVSYFNKKVSEMEIETKYKMELLGMVTALGYAHEKEMSDLSETKRDSIDLDEWCNTCREYDSERHCCPRFNRVIREALKEAQPEVVHCRDCKYYEWTSNRVPEEQTWHCYNWNADTGKNDYCSYAERREDEEIDS